MAQSMKQDVSVLDREVYARSLEEVERAVSQGEAVPAGSVRQLLQSRAVLRLAGEKTDELDQRLHGLVDTARGWLLGGFSGAQFTEWAKEKIEWMMISWYAAEEEEERFHSVAFRDEFRESCDLLFQERVLWGLMHAELIDLGYHNDKLVNDLAAAEKVVDSAMLAHRRRFSVAADLYDDLLERLHLQAPQARQIHSIVDLADTLGQSLICANVCPGELLQAYVDFQREGIEEAPWLDQKDRERIEAHLKDCDLCRVELRESHEFVRALMSQEDGR